MVNPLYKKGFFTSAPSPEAYLGDLKADGTVPLTAAWNAGPCGITALNLTAAPTIDGELITGATAITAWTASHANWTLDTNHWDHVAGSTRTITANWTPTANHKSE